MGSKINKVEKYSNILMLGHFGALCFLSILAVIFKSVFITWLIAIVMIFLMIYTAIAFITSTVLLVKQINIQIEIFLARYVKD